MRIFFVAAIILSAIALSQAAHAELVCSVVTSCAYTDVLHLSANTNAHAELANGTGYSYKICCYDTIEEVSIGTSCSGRYSKFLKLSNTTNAHVEKGTQSNYPYDVCISTSMGNVTCEYASSCYGYDTCLASISSTESGGDTNLHISDCYTNPYVTKICCSTSGAVPGKNVTFEMSLNISGPSSDEGFADSYGIGYYTNLTKKYLCVQDILVSNAPAFGIAFGGSGFSYANLSLAGSYRMRLSQTERGNRFIIPVTINSCNAVSSKTPLGELVQSFVGFLGGINNIELSLKYTMIDIIGNVHITGPAKLIIEKNESNEKQILIDVV
jgi:hypothetical protein